MTTLSRRQLLARGGAALGAALGARLLAPAAALAAPGAVAHNAAALQIARVWPHSDRQRAALGALDDTHRVFADGSAEYLLWPGDLERLRGIGARFEITDADVLGARRLGGAQTVAPQPGQREDYRRLRDYEDDLRDLERRFPGLAKVFVLAERSVEGRQVLGIEIANPIGVRDGRPTAMLDGAHHAREWPSCELPMMFAYDLLENYGSDARVTRIVDTQRTLIVPVVNVDGFHYSRESVVYADDSTPPGAGPALSLGLAAAGAESYWRKNRRSVTGVTLPTGTNPDAYGTDPNRNYPFYWGGSGSSSLQADQTHRGSAPYAEPESRNIARLLLANQVTALITNHTSGQLCMRPWGAVPDESPDNALQEAVGASMVAFNGYQNILARQLYNTAGTSRDWAYAALSTLVWTYEHGTEFHGPYLATVPEMYRINREPYLILCELAGDASTHAVVRGAVVDSSSGAPLNATVRLHKSFETQPFTGAPVPETIDAPITTGEDGAFSYHINPTTRPYPAVEEGTVESADVIVSAPGKAPQTFPVTLGRGQVADLGTIAL